MADRTESESPTGPSVATAGAARHLFISYASQDAELAQKACSALEAVGFTCWMAPRDVRPGALYADAIIRAINEAQAVVLVLSASAVTSTHVGREVERAASKHKQIIALRLDAAPLNPALEYFLGESQWIDVPALGMQTALTKLAEAVGRGPTAPAGQAPANKRVGETTKRLAIAAVILVCVGVATVLGMHFWSLNHRAAQAAAPAAITDKSIAVLPFVDMSEKKDQEYFADGMAEEVLDLLAKLPGIRVIGRTSSFQFKGKAEDLRKIGSTLGAAYVVEGSVRKSGERLRVTAQLIGAQDGSHLWSETYDDDVGDVLKVQDRIAAGLVRALQVSVGADELQSRPPVKNAEAYDLYLRGRHAMDRFDKPGLETAVGYFQQALELDPSFIRAAEWLALAHEDLPELGFVPPREGYERARASVQRGLALDPKSGQLHSLMALIHAIYDWDWPAAEQEGKLALALDSRDPLVLGNVGQVYMGLGQWDDSARLLRASAAIDPLNAGQHYVLASTCIATGSLIEAEAESRMALQISPSFAGAHYLLGWTLLLEGRSEQALAEMQQDACCVNLGLALVYYRMGRKAESDEALEQYTKEHATDDAFDIADVHAYRGEVDQAFLWLDRAYSQKDPALYTIKADPDFKSIAPDSRYKAFLRKMNLPE
jgi:TolB-like protein/Tfp pilus assembly protein PilF